MANMEDYKKKFCPYCKNRDNYDCDLRYCLDNIPRCSNYELDREKLKKDYGALWQLIKKNK